MARDDWDVARLAAHQNAMERQEEARESSNVDPRAVAQFARADAFAGAVLWVSGEYGGDHPQIAVRRIDELTLHWARLIETGEIEEEVS